MILTFLYHGPRPQLLLRGELHATVSSACLIYILFWRVYLRQCNHAIAINSKFKNCFIQNRSLKLRRTSLFVDNFSARNSGQRAAGEYTDDEKDSEEDNEIEEDEEDSSSASEHADSGSNSDDSFGTNVARKRLSKDVRKSSSFAHSDTLFVGGSAAEFSATTSIGILCIRRFRSPSTHLNYLRRSSHAFPSNCPRFPWASTKAICPLR